LWLGSFTLIAQAGIVSGALPYAKLYTGIANMTNGSVQQRYFAIADRHSFETMRVNEFLSDRYMQFLFRQDLKTLLFRRNNFAPHIELVTRAAWGDLRNPELHLNLPTARLNHGFFESGFEVNRLYSSKIGGFESALGLGFYYRYGANSLVGFENNFALKFTSKFIF
jgi:hypothetical protein